MDETEISWSASMVSQVSKSRPGAPSIDETLVTGQESWMRNILAYKFF
jgi:hypothetical protein